MKEKITNNLVIKALSLCLALVFWILVINIDDPVRTRQFANVPVSIINENAVSTMDKVYEVVQGKTVDITVTGKKSLVDKVTMQDLKATADLSQLSVVNAVNIYPECTKYPSLNCSLGRVQTLKVSLESVGTIQLVPVIQQIGTVAEGYYVVNATSKPNIIKVTGAKSQIKKVSEIRLEVDVSNAKKDLLTMAEVKAYDANNTELEKEKFKFSVSQAKVDLEVRKTKTIPVVLDIINKAGHGYQCVSTEYEPKQIVIAGRNHSLAGVDELVIPIDLSGYTENRELTLNPSDYLPDNITVSEANPTISVQLEMEKLVSQNFYFRASDVALNGKKESYHYGREEKQKLYTVTLLAMQKVLDTLTIEKLNPHIEAEALEKGEQEADILVDLPEDVEMLSGSMKLKLKVS